MDSGRADANCGGAIVCEDFDSYANGAFPDAAGPWALTTPNCSGTGTIAIDETEAHSGARSLKVTGAAGYCNHAFLGTNAVAQISSAVWGRFYVRLTTALTADHATFLAMHDSTSNHDLRMGGQDSVLMWNRESDDATLPAMSPQGTADSVVVSPSVWHCIEFKVQSAPGEISTWVDGVAVIGLITGDGGAPAANSQWTSSGSFAPVLTDARFGWESYASEAETLWFDDIAIGAARIGCGGP